MLLRIHSGGGPGGGAFYDSDLNGSHTSNSNHVLPRFLFIDKRVHTMRDGLEMAAWRDEWAETDVLRCRSRTTRRNYFTLCIYLSSVFLFKSFEFYFQRKSVIHAYETGYLQRDGHLPTCIHVSLSVILWEDGDVKLVDIKVSIMLGSGADDIANIESVCKLFRKFNKSQQLRSEMPGTCSM